MKHIGDVEVTPGAASQSNGKTLSPRRDWLPRTPLHLPLDPALREEALRSVQAASQRRLEKQFGRMVIPRRYQGLSPATLTAEELADRQAAIIKAELWMLGKSVKPGLLIWGLPGVGKSVLGWWAVSQRAGWGLWLTWPEFYKTIQHGYRSGDARVRLEMAKTVPVLFLDDLGDPDCLWLDSEGKLQGKMATDDQRSIFFELINHRCKEWLPIFITSNLTGSGLMIQFGDRNLSRLLELCEFIEMRGMDLRRLHLEDKP